MHTNRGSSRLARRLAGALVASLSVLSLPLTAAYGQPPNASAHVEAPAPATVDAQQLAELRATADQLRAWLTKHRGVPLHEPVTLAVRSKEDLRAHLVATVEREVSPAYLAAHQRTMEMLRLLPEGQSYLDLLLGLLEDQVAGYYDHEEKTFYLLDSDVQNFDATVIAHELQHAAQDLRWDLGAWMRPPWKVSDISTARGALIEGDATLTMFAYALDNDLSGFDAASLDGARAQMRASARAGSPTTPQFLLDGLVGSYAQGLVFAGSLYLHDGWKSVNAAFDARPLSSEQVLYPERYLAGDAPTFLRFDSAEDLVGTRVLTDILGMSNARDAFYDLLKGVATEQEIDAATRTWDGDRMELWQSDRADTLQWLWVFDTVEGADRLFQLLERALPIWSGGTPADRQCADGLHGGRCGMTHGQRGAMVERWGDMLLIVIRHEHAAQAEASTLLAIGEAVWTTATRSRYPDAFR